jgi:hypothetical protein
MNSSGPALLDRPPAAVRATGEFVAGLATPADEQAIRRLLGSSGVPGYVEHLDGRPAYFELVAV